MKYLPLMPAFFLNAENPKSGDTSTLPHVCNTLELTTQLLHFAPITRNHGSSSAFVQQSHLLTCVKFFND